MTAAQITKTKADNKTMTISPFVPLKTDACCCWLAGFAGCAGSIGKN